MLDHLISVLLAIGFLAVIVITILHGNAVRAENEKRERQLLLALAHDIRTPLTVIRGYAEGLYDGVADTEEKKTAYLLRIKQKAIEMDGLLSDLMLYAKATSDCLIYDMRDVRISEELLAYVSDVREDMALRGAEISLSDEIDGDIRIKADTEQFKRVLDNLLSNSVKYKKGQTVRVELLLSATDSEVRLTVSDDGKGIRAEELPHIFDNLYRGSGAEGGISGSGIGLWLVHRIVTDHGGSIVARSEYGEGTSFDMIFSRKEDI